MLLIVDLPRRCIWIISQQLARQGSDVYPK